MPQVINTNVLSLNAQRNLNTSASALATSLQRLSSGLRINSAKDDAAGLAISERFTTQIRGLNQAVRNANDGISLAQTAEGALSEVTNNLQRIRELAVQSRNATNSAADRTAIDTEVQQRIQEIQRVASQTDFNGTKLLDGSFTSQVFQVGANFGQTINVNAIGSATASALGLVSGTLTSYTTTGGVMTGVTSATDLKLTVGSVDYAVGAATDAISLANAINASGSGVSATTQANAVTGSAVTAAAVAAITINGAAIGGFTIASADQAGAAAYAVKINTDLATGGVTNVTATATAGGAITLTSTTGANIVVAGTVANSGLTAATTWGKVSLSSDVAYTVADGGSGNLAKTGLAAGAGGSSPTNYANFNVTTAANADIVMRVVDKALTTVNGSRAALGAIQNRFESVINNLSTTSENMTAARSRIQDADFASETAAMTRGQILQQAGTAILSQANSAPQNVLSLLR